MKKLILSLTAAVSLLAFPAFGQTISVTGVNSTIGTASGSFVDVTLSLSITGTNSIANVESINMLLRTFAQGSGLSGNGLFSLSMITPIAPFTLANNPVSSNFDTAADVANQVGGGGTVSNPSADRGVNAPAASAAPVAGTGTTTFAFETIRFTSLSILSPGSIYNFSVTLGGNGDAQGSWVDNSSNQLFGINSAPTFTITVVPEPATLSLLGLGGLGSFGLTVLRARRKIG